MSVKFWRSFRRLPAVLLLMSIVLSSHSANAAAVGLWSLGLDFGIALPNTSSQTVAWGLELTRRFSASFGIELSLVNYGAGISIESGTAQVDANTSQSFIGVKPAYYFQGGAGLWQLGMRMGTSSTSITSTTVNSTSGTTTTIDDSHSNLFVGPSIAYDYPMGSVTIGGELCYLVGLGTLPPKALLLVAAIKYWF